MAVVAVVGLLLSDSLPSSSFDEDDDVGDEAHRLRALLPPMKFGFDDAIPNRKESGALQLFVLKLVNDRPNMKDDDGGGMLQHSQPVLVARAPDVVVLKVAHDVMFCSSACRWVPPSWQRTMAAVAALRAREDERLMVEGTSAAKMSGCVGLRTTCK